MERPNSRKLLPHAKQMRKAPSDAEHKLWQALRDRRLEGLKFRRQLPIGPFIADFACDECKLIVEVDGRQHDDDNAIQYDQQRTIELQKLGWRVLRFYAGDVVKHIDFVLRSILVDARPHPNPRVLDTSREYTGEGTRDARRGSGTALKVCHAPLHA